MQGKASFKRILMPAWTLRQWLIISCMFSCLLVATRCVAKGEMRFLFLLWNLVLALIPYAISEWLCTRIRIMESRWKLAVVLVGWLLFIPNSFYILTDLFHLFDASNVPKWFDLLLIFSFAWNGLLLGLLSVRRIEQILQVISGRSVSLLFVFAVMWLNAFGVYIGRYLRYNTWDVVSRPFALMQELLGIIIHPLRFRMDWGMVFAYAIFMTVLYETIKKMSSQFHQTIK